MNLNLENDIRKVSSNNKSGRTGVSFDKSKNKWRAQIGYNNKKFKIGLFDTKEEAISARERAEIEFYKIKSTTKDPIPTKKRVKNKSVPKKSETKINKNKNIKEDVVVTKHKYRIIQTGKTDNYYDIELSKTEYDLVSNILDNLKNIYIVGVGALYGKKYGKWTVIDDSVKIIKDSIGNRTYLKCKCVCGKEDLVSKNALINGKTFSCGCTQELAPKNKTSQIMQEVEIISSPIKIEDLKCDIKFNENKNLWIPVALYCGLKLELGSYDSKEKAENVKKEALIQTTNFLEWRDKLLDRINK